MTENKLIITAIGKPEKWLVEAAAEIGLNISGNARTDMTGIKKVVGAGGKPGEEAE
jgi:hypothetical protein